MKEVKEQNIKSNNKIKYFIGDYNEAPSYMKDNHHITHGYRIGFDTPKKIFRSLFMVHNQIVNIWSHFVPALLLICLIIYLIIFVDTANIINDLNNSRIKFSKDIRQYSDTLNNLSFVIKMKSIQSQTSRQMEQLKQAVFNSYNNFQLQLRQWNVYMSNQLFNIQSQVKYQLQHQLNQLESLKTDYEKVFIPYILNQIKIKIDSEYLQQLTQKLNKIKQKLDSSTYDYIQLQSNIPNPNLVSRWPVVVFLFSAAICLLCSTTFHLFYPMSGNAYQVFSRLDYAGINILISGSSFPALYFGMYCNFSMVVFYLIFICSLGLTLFIVTLFKYLHRPQNFVIKSLAYGGFSLSLAIPLSHGIINEVVFDNYGDLFSIKSSMVYYSFGACFYIFGLYVYTVRCPERHYQPGKFNVCGNSHQIWHLLVVLGIISTYLGALQNLEARKLYVCPIKS